MRSKKKVSGGRKNVTLKLILDPKRERTNSMRNKVKTIKTVFANKPMFDPIAGP